jgi:hypothetical protein
MPHSGIGHPVERAASQALAFQDAPLFHSQNSRAGSRFADAKSRHRLDQAAQPHLASTWQDVLCKQGKHDRVRIYRNAQLAFLSRYRYYSGSSRIVKSGGLAKPISIQLGDQNGDLTIPFEQAE